MVLFGESKMHSSCAIRSKKNTKQIKAQKMLFPTEEQHTKHELQYSKTEQVRKNKKKKNERRRTILKQVHAQNAVVRYIARHATAHCKLLSFSRSIV